MGFRFIHTADWQLGRSFKQFEPELAAQLAAVRLDVIETIGKIAEDEAIDHVFVAGDVWDIAAPSDRLLRQPLDRMGAFESVTWWLMPGNHDPAEKHGLWDRLGSMDTPANVRAVTKPEVFYPEPGVAILPAPFQSRMPGRDQTEAFTTMDVDEGSIRIGLAHGGVVGFFDQSAQSAVIAKDRAFISDLDYLALGDWHGAAEVNEKTWYSGSPEPDRFPTNDPGWVLVVDVDRGSDPIVKKVKTAKYTWTRDRVDCVVGVDPKSEISALFNQPGPRHLRLSRLELHGELPMTDRMELLAFLDNEKDSLAHLRERYDGLITVVDPDSLEEIVSEGALRDAAAKIAARINDESSSTGEKAIARRALDLLVTFSGEPEKS